MAVRVVIVGPGRVGAACGRRLHESGFEIVGFIGRQRAGAERAVAFAGAGRVLEPGDHVEGHVVLVAVGDPDLETTVVGLTAAAPPRSCSLWVHTSGSHDLAVLAPASAGGARRGALHPVAPFPDAEAGYRAMAGQPAVITGDPAAMELLEKLAHGLAMTPVVMAGNAEARALYHAGCALAANGLVALRGLVDTVLGAAGGLAPADADRIATALMTMALAGTNELGAAAALSGPVRRGDHATVARHLEALGRQVPAAVPGYRALMVAAIDLAVERGLDAQSAARLRDLLDR